MLFKQTQKALVECASKEETRFHLQHMHQIEIAGTDFLCVSDGHRLFATRQIAMPKPTPVSYRIDSFKASGDMVVSGEEIQAPPITKILPHLGRLTKSVRFRVPEWVG